MISGIKMRSSVSLSRLCLKYTSSLVINTITRFEACIH